MLKNKIMLGLLFLMSSGTVASLYAATGFLKGEETSGMNKICYYNVLGSTHAITIKSYKLCPLTIKT